MKGRRTNEKAGVMMLSSKRQFKRDKVSISRYDPETDAGQMT